MGELESFGAKLESKPMILVASKCDVANKTKLAKLKKLAKSRDLDVYSISAVTGEGVDKLLFGMAEKVEEVRRADANQDRSVGLSGNDERPTTNDAS
jgi:GTP-binding protein